MEARTPPILLLSAPRTSTAELLARAASWRGYEVTDRAASAEGRRVHWYGGPRAAARLAGPLGLGLLEPADDWLTRVPEPLLRRHVRLTTLAEARTLREPAFVKPPSAKIDLLPAAVHEDGTSLPAGLDDSTPVLVSGVVEFTAEYRLFVLDGEAVTGSRYAVHGRLDPAPLDADSRAFGRTVLDATADDLPSAVCLDIGRLADGGWAVVEANMAWFAHCYAAEPERVLDTVLRAAGPLTAVTARDRPHLNRSAARPDGIGHGPYQRVGA
ncbi:ATP-grasp domain-containing protein [Streptomyces antimicrobicus]|uniref:ATP-grasp domain-containing protein n=1 Tax=Streptomyces antimicrobicus TaxID=2883108 RepID=A0ABS8B041_9ACTN|nr:ATP-grasp domain-containing protein [Streptomyces antimicrobicus]MCB5177972.1 ATP-grasp domain-containing protein [Streptomyces antimicrobicus]